ncbi:hypothetical protein LDENG_00003500 [Lucifuga dentata]|nr:hypothetical protein LDENG_00003500 [Lucifuga dentata]
MKKVLSGCKSPLLKHVVSHHRQVYMILNNRQADLNLKFHVRVDDFDYILYGTSETMRCFGCGQEGHVIRVCPEKPSQEASEPDDVGDGVRGQTGTQEADRQTQRGQPEETDRQTQRGQAEETDSVNSELDNTKDNVMENVNDVRQETEDSSELRGQTQGAGGQEAVRQEVNGQEAEEQEVGAREVEMTCDMEVVRPVLHKRKTKNVNVATQRSKVSKEKQSAVCESSESDEYESDSSLASDVRRSA